MYFLGFTMGAACTAGPGDCIPIEVDYISYISMVIRSRTILDRFLYIKVMYRMNRGNVITSNVYYNIILHSG